MIGRPLCFAVLAVTTVFTSTARSQQTIETLDFFGLRRVSEADVRAKLKLKEGDLFHRDRIAGIMAELVTIPGVRDASVAPVTVSGGSLRVFIGIQEAGSRGFMLREKPTGEQRLPEQMAQLYRDTMNAWSAAVRSGTGREDHSQGHAISADAALRKLQEATVDALKSNAALVPRLRDVLASSSSASDRAAAAWLLGYAPDKKIIVDDLMAAAHDPDAIVRNNATRGLGVIADFAAGRPDAGIQVAPDVFIAMLGSLTWTDRNKASFLLDSLTKSRRPELLRALRAEALPDLIDIARWKSEGHAFAARSILGRIAGWPEEEIGQLRHAADGEKVIAAASRVE